ncbi:MAG: ester cyclase [Terracoccus sp.]
MTTTTPATPSAPSVEPEWGPSVALLAHEQANVDAFSTVFPHWNRGDISAMLEQYEDDIVWRNIAMGEVYDGKAAVRAFLEDLFRALPDLNLDITLRVPRGKYVAEEYVIRGTHLGPMFGLPASGRRLEIRVMSMVEMRNGRLKEDHFYFDAAGVMQQMGYLPDTSAVRKPAGRVVMGILGWWRRRGSSVS